MSPKPFLLVSLILFSQTLFAVLIRPSASQPDYMLHTEGAYLVNAVGEHINLQGVCFNNFLDSSTGWFPGGEYFEWDEVAVVNNLETLASWECNFLACAIWYDWFLRDANDSLSGSGTTNIGCREAIVRLIELAYDYGIYVGVGLFGISPSIRGSSTVQYIIANSSEYIDFWLMLSNTLNVYSNVVYGIITEVSEDEVTMNSYFHVITQAVQEIRTRGDEHILLYHEDYCGYPIRFDKPATQSGEALRRLHENASNIVYDAHTYRWHGTFGGNPDYFDPSSAKVTNSDGVYQKDHILDALTHWGYFKITTEYEIPIVMWEGGANNEVSPPNSWTKEITCWQNLLSIFNEFHIGYAAFWWRTSGPWALINNDLSPTEWGQVLRESIDPTPPNITDIVQFPPENNVTPQDEVKITATVTDHISGVRRVTLNYTIEEGTWSAVEMSDIGGNVWNASIPTLPYCTHVSYTIIAEDNVGNIITSEELFQHQHQYHVVPELSSLLILPLITTLVAAIICRKRRFAAAE